MLNAPWQKQKNALQLRLPTATTRDKNLPRLQQTLQRLLQRLPSCAFGSLQLKLLLQLRLRGPPPQSPVPSSSLSYSSRLRRPWRSAALALSHPLQRHCMWPGSAALPRNLLQKPPRSMCIVCKQRCMHSCSSHVAVPRRLRKLRNLTALYLHRFDLYSFVRMLSHLDICCATFWLGCAFVPLSQHPT